MILQSKKFIDGYGKSQVVLCCHEGGYIWEEGTSNISKLEYIGSESTSDAEFMPQKKILLICHDKALLLIDTYKYELVMEIPVDGSYGSKIAISVDETYIAYLSNNGQINIYDVHTGKIVLTKQHAHALDVEFSQDNCLVTISSDEISLWSLTKETPLVTRPILRPQSDYNEGIGTSGQIAISNNRELLVLTVNDFHLRIFNTVTLELIATFTHRNRIHTCAIGSDPERENMYYITIGDSEGEVHFFQLYV